MFLNVRLKIVGSVFVLGYRMCSVAIRLLPSNHPTAQYMRGRMALGQKSCSYAVELGHRS